MSIRLNQSKIDYLQKVFELTDGDPLNGFHRRDLTDILGISEAEERSSFEHLEYYGFVKRFLRGRVIITPAGKDELVKIMKPTYADKEYLVLKTIYEACKENNYNGISHYSLEEKVNLDEHELNMILIGIGKKDLLSNRSTGTYIIEHKGMEYLDRYENSPQNAGGINNFTFNAPVGAFQHQTQHSTQNVNQQVNITNNADFNSAIESIVSLIKDSSLANFKKEDLISDIERIQNLAKQEPSPELVEHAKSKINYLDTALKATDLAVKIAPYLPQVYAFFDGLLKTS